MRTATTAALLALALTTLVSTAFATAPKPEEFVVSLYQRFAFRDPTPNEVMYWADKIVTMTPEAAETHLKNWFFVHAAYKTSLDRTVTIQEVEHMVDLLDKGQITYESIQWTIFASDEYKKVKAEGRAGQDFMHYRPSPF